MGRLAPVERILVVLDRTDDDIDPMDFMSSHATHLAVVVGQQGSHKLEIGAQTRIVGEHTGRAELGAALPTVANASW